MKYEIGGSVDKPGLPWHGNEIELPEESKILYIRIGTKSFDHIKFYDDDWEKLFNRDALEYDYKYDENTGVYLMPDKDRRLTEFQVFTRIHYIMPKIEK
jgi:hypothetical protein